MTVRGLWSGSEVEHPDDLEGKVLDYGGRSCDSETYSNHG